MRLTKEDAQDMVANDSDDFNMVEETITDVSRWSIHYTGIFRHNDSKKLYRANWSCGATESQDEAPFEYDDEGVDLIEVVPVEKTVTAYQEKF